MSLRLDYKAVSPDSYQCLRDLEIHVRTNGLEPQLKNLIYIRASQLNGCAFCLDMHMQEAKEAGESEQRLFALPAWRDTPFFSERERAVLALTERVTLIAQGGVDDATYATAAEYFDEAQMVQLLLAIATINNWNRISISVGMQPSQRLATKIG